MFNTPFVTSMMLIGLSYQRFGRCDSSWMIPLNLKEFLEKIGERVCSSTYEPLLTKQKNDLNFPLFDLSLQECSNSNSSVYVFRMPTTDQSVEEKKLIESKMIQVVNIVTENILDQRICAIRECRQAFGKYCDSSGEAVNYCSMRNTSKTTKPALVCLEVDKILPNLLKGVKDIQTLQAQTDKTVVVVERLLAYQHRYENSLRISVQEWTNLFRRFGMHVNDDSFATMLYGLNHPTTEYQSHGIIYNYNQLETAIRHTGNLHLLTMLRRPDSKIANKRGKIASHPGGKGLGKASPILAPMGIKTRRQGNGVLETSLDPSTIEDLLAG